MNSINISYEDWVRRFVEIIAKEFNLSEWTINVVFSDEDQEANPETSGAYATNKISSTYLISTITFYRQAKIDFTDRTFKLLITAIVHELTHIFLDPFHEYVDPFLSRATTPGFMTILEQQTQRLTAVFLKNLPEKVQSMIGEATHAEDQNESQNQKNQDP
jgi:hypothetical protein